jgi:PemK-like, MazF-like toxin of type II toxin-antitoxin system
MSFLSRVGQALRSALASTPKATTSSQQPARTRRHTSTPAAPAGVDELPSPGQTGQFATVEIDPRGIGAVRMTYSPSTDGAPDPGEVVWTWVPFEERDGRGKDRPVLVVAAERSGTYLAVQLTSKPHQGNAEFVPIGSGEWDSAGRPSWVNIDRVFRLHTGGMRRETVGLPDRAFAAVATRLRERYGWH